MSFLKAPITSMTMGGLAFLLTMFFLLQKPIQATGDHHDNVEEDNGPAGFWERHNPETDQLLQEVHREKESLAKREAELRELTTRLQAERAEITAVTQRVAQLQAEFDQNVTRIKEDEVPNLKRLVRLYAGMSPEGIAAIMKELDDQTVVKVFSMMKDSDSAQLLDSMAKGGEAQAKRAASITDALRRTITEKKK